MPAPVIRPSRFRVLTTPSLSPWLLLASRKHGAATEPFGSGRFLPCYQARYALWHAARGLGLPAGSNVAVPAYQCGTELDGFLALGLELRFYRVDDALRVDLESLRETIDEKTVAVLVTHYFGFPQIMAPIVDVCRHHRLRLIEDCAHTVFGRYQGRYLGTFGDAGVFSMRKLLPTPDGAAVLANNPTMTLPGALTPPARRETRGQVKIKMKRRFFAWLEQGRLRRTFKARLLLPTVGALRKGHEGPSADAIQELGLFRPERIEWGMAELSSAIFRNVDTEALCRRRRRNFEYLLRELVPTVHLRPLYDTLPEGVVPWVFPVVAEEPYGFIRYLQERGIEIGIFWQKYHHAFREGLYPDVDRLRHRILTLPVHQDLTARDLKMIVEVTNAWRGEAAGAEAGTGTRADAHAHAGAGANS